MLTTILWSQVTRCRYVCAAHGSKGARDEPLGGRPPGSHESRFCVGGPYGHLHPRDGRGDELPAWLASLERSATATCASWPPHTGRPAGRVTPPRSVWTESRSWPLWFCWQTGAAGTVGLAAVGCAGGRDDGEPGGECRGGGRRSDRPGGRRVACVRAPGGSEAAVGDAGNRRDVDRPADAQDRPIRIQDRPRAPADGGDDSGAPVGPAASPRGDGTNDHAGTPRPADMRAVPRRVTGNGLAGVLGTGTAVGPGTEPGNVAGTIKAASAGTGTASSTGGSEEPDLAALLPAACAARTVCSTGVIS